METDYKHIAANIYNHQFWSTCIDPTELVATYKNHLIEAGFTILLFNEHHFPEKGYTCFWLLGESHLAIHTFPESGKSYIELSSCNLDKLEKFKKL